MVKSMTGFGRGEAGNESRKVMVEIRSVNHRYLDLNIKVPRKLNAFEGDIRNYIKSQILRGKVDIYVSLEESADATGEVRYNSAIASMYLNSIQAMCDELNVENDIRASHLSRFPDVLTIAEVEEDEEALKELVLEALASATEKFVENREFEGARLREDLLGKMDEMNGYVTLLEKRSPQIIKEYRARLTEKVKDLLDHNTVDENRISAEVVIYADKVCIDEEMVRLRSHVDETRRMLDTEDEVGRKLDFIAQEMNREANTILSKSTDVELADVGISLKTLIEKVREQIQNLE